MPGRHEDSGHLSRGPLTKLAHDQGGGLVGVGWHRDLVKRRVAVMLVSPPRVVCEVFELVGEPGNQLCSLAHEFCARTRTRPSRGVARARTGPAIGDMWAKSLCIPWGRQDHESGWRGVQGETKQEPDRLRLVSSRGLCPGLPGPVEAGRGRGAPSRSGQERGEGRAGGRGGWRIRVFEYPC
jgi:hypothetical protein